MSLQPSLPSRRDLTSGRPSPVETTYGTWDMIEMSADDVSLLLVELDAAERSLTHLLDAVVEAGDQLAADEAAGVVVALPCDRRSRLSQRRIRTAS